MNCVYAVDFEGNGETPADIVELALVDVLDWQRIGKTHYWLLQPSAPISKLVSRIHGLTDKDVADAPHFSSVENELRRLLHSATLIGHNVRVDAAALSRKLPGWEPARLLDTLRLARRLMPGLSSYALDNLREILNLAPNVISGRGERPHSAAYDATITAALFFHLLADNAGLGLGSILQLATVPQHREQRSLFDL